MEKLIRPGWYRSALPDLRNAVHVHAVEDGRVYFTRRGLPHMSISPLSSFVGIVDLYSFREATR